MAWQSYPHHVWEARDPRMCRCGRPVDGHEAAMALLPPRRPRAAEQHSHTTVVCPRPDKKTYPTKAKANRARLKVKNKATHRGVGPLRPYLCSTGDHWHLTHHPKGVIERAEPKESA
jgi:hypothetical protein